MLFVSFNGLTKTYQVTGFRSEMMVVSGAKQKAADFLEGLELLTSMRLCSNVPGQYAWKKTNELPRVSCVKPKGAMYLFVKLDPDTYPIKNDKILYWIYWLRKKYC